MLDSSIENKFIEKLRKRLILENIDISQLRKKERLDAKYSFGIFRLAIFQDSDSPHFQICWDDACLGRDYFSYEKWDFKNLDEQMDVFVDDVIMYYKNPKQRWNFIIRSIDKILNKLKNKFFNICLGKNKKKPK